MIENDRTVRAEDGTQIAYGISGRGPAVVLTNGLTTTSFFWKYLWSRLSERYTVITWDLPGHGRSSPAESAEAAAIESQPAHLARVLDAAGIDAAVQLGWSVGCQIVLETYRQRPDRCRALGLLFGPAEHALGNTRLLVPGTLIDRVLSTREGARVAALLQRVAPVVELPGGPALLRKLRIIGPRTSHADLHELVAELRAVDPGTVRLMACSAERHSASDVLARIAVPTLVMAGEHDPFAPPDAVGASLHQAIERSEFVRVPGVTHTALLEDPDSIAAAVEPFLAAHAS